jgi:hypothetical protein
MVKQHLKEFFTDIFEKNNSSATNLVPNHVLEPEPEPESYSQQECLSGLWRRNTHGNAHGSIALPQLSYLLSSEASGRCPTCTIVVKAINCLFPNTKHVIKTITCDDSRDTVFWFWCDNFHENEQVEIFISETNIKKQPHLLTGSPKGEPAIAVRRITSGDTSSQDSIEWSRRWIDYCIQNHERCVKKHKTQLPTRVIDVTPDGEFESFGAVRLVDQAHHLASDQYVALSHCWGKVVPQCLTTKSTLQTRTHRIPWESLPRTFQEAITFTRGLQIRYLWIDSVCIVQDDGLDWRRESAKMDTVYCNSYVTLAAVHAENGHGGLFSRLSKLYHPHIISQIETNGKPQNIFARRRLPYRHRWEPDDLTTDCPLFSRAWAYQERLVAPRVIYFTNCELLWGCFECAACECGGNFPTGERSVFNVPKIRHLQTLETGRVQERWVDIVEEFSRLDLTMHRDKLPAISAIAKQVQQYRPTDKYLAGMWHDTLLDDLLWVRAYSRNGPSHRPTETLAPTWSWTSISGGVSYSRILSKDKKKVKRVKLLHVSCENIQDDNYGQVRSASLVVFGKLVNCFIHTAEYSTSLENPTVGIFELATERGIDAKCVFVQDCLNKDDDYGTQSDQKTKHVFLLKLLESEHAICCLVLVKLLNRNAYQRIGLVMAYSFTKEFPEIQAVKEKLINMFSNVQESDITIE